MNVRNVEGEGVAALPAVLEVVAFRSDWLVRSEVTGDLPLPV